MRRICSDQTDQLFARQCHDALIDAQPGGLHRFSDAVEHGDRLRAVDRLNRDISIAIDQVDRERTFAEEVATRAQRLACLVIEHAGEDAERGDVGLPDGVTVTTTKAKPTDGG